MADVSKLRVCEVVQRASQLVAGNEELSQKILEDLWQFSRVLVPIFQEVELRDYHVGTVECNGVLVPCINRRYSDDDWSQFGTVGVNWEASLLFLKDLPDLANQILEWLEYDRQDLERYFSLCEKLRSVV